MGRGQDFRRDSWGNYVGGEMVLSSASDRLEIRNPARAESLGTVPIASAADVDTAVEVAVAAFRGWRDQPQESRLEVVERCRRILRDNVDELAWLDAANCGNPISACRDDVLAVESGIGRVVGFAGALHGQTVSSGRREEMHLTRWEPFGVVAMIIPFNHPTAFAVYSLAPIAVGNTVVLKPSEQAPLSALRLAELLGEVLPAGVLNVVTGSGAPTGNALVSHPAVRSLFFIGSSAVGRQIIKDAADTAVKRTVLELGGKNPLIVCADADVDRVADAAIRGMNVERCQGQSCQSTSRLLVERAVYDEVVEAVGSRLAAIHVGDPLEESTRMGSLVSPAQQQRVLSFIDGARAQGARVVGGKAPSDGVLARGAFVEPTLLADVDRTMTVANEEVFGPVVSAMPWDSEAEAIDIANSVRYGLTASIWTPDLGRALRLSSDVEAARVFVNSPVHSVHGLAPDAWKDSGLGLTGDWAAGLTNFLRSKEIHLSG